MDLLTPRQRSKNMAAIRSKGTKDELGSVKWLPADLEVVEKLNKHI